jgi:hypothetical protein
MNQNLGILSIMQAPDRVSPDQFKSQIKIVEWIVPMICDPHGISALEHPWSGVRFEHCKRRGASCKDRPTAT